MAGGAPRSEAVRRAHQVIENAWTTGRPYDLASQAAFALESAQLLQSPETAAEVERQVRELVAEAIERRGAAFLPAHPVFPYVGVFASIARGAEVAPVADASALDELERLRARVAALEARPAPGAVLRSFAARVDQMREDGDPSVWLSAWEAVSEVLEEAYRLAAEATRKDPDHVCDFRYSGPTAGTRCVGCHLPAEGAQGAKKLDEASFAQPAAAPITVYRAQHDSIPMGLYTNLAAAQAHCEAKVRQEEPAGSIKSLDWWADPEEDQPAYELSIIPVDTSSGMRTTGYFVTPLLVDPEFDEDGDE